MTRFSLAPYGAPALGAVACAVEAGQGGDPLAPVTVVVPRSQVGLAVRRRLAARPGGVCNVAFVTLPALAARLAVDWLASTDRRPLTRPVLQEAVRAVLRTARGGLLGPVREEPATARALVATYRELRGVRQEVRAGLAAQSRRAAEVLGLADEVDERLAGWFDEADVTLAATGAVRSGGLPAGTGPVVLYLPRRLRAADADLVQAIGQAGELTVIAGVTGDAEADGPTLELVRRLGGSPTAAAGGPAVVHGTEVVLAPTADAEVLAALRYLMTRNRAGVPLERMAVAHGGNSPYPRLLHDALQRADIPFNGGGVRPLAATVAGRVLSGVLALADHDWRRDEVAAWLTTAPLLDERGRRIPGNAWDALSCEAGVVHGLGEWRERLVAHAAALRHRAAATGSDEAGPLQAAAGECDRLLAFVEEVARWLAPAADSWAGWAGWARRLVRHLVGEGPHQVDWPAAEVAALDAVLEAVQGLAALGGAQASLAQFRAALLAELDSPAPQTARFGRGVLVGRIEEMVGLDLDELCVVGMIDGAFPGRAADDALLPDQEREVGGGEVPYRVARPAEARRDYLAALAAARRRRLSCAVGDQRHGREQRPSRLLLDTVGALAGAGRRLYAGDLPQVGGHRLLPSYAATVVDGEGEPVSPHDWDLRSLTRWVVAGGDPAHHFLARSDEALGRGFELRRARRQSRFTRFDGRVDDVVVSSPGGAGAQSATGLEAFARCPRRYLLATLLQVAVRQPPEAVVRIGPLERGNVVHRVLERFVGEALATGPVDPATPWGAAGEARLVRIAEQVFADVERRGLTGREALWRIDRAAILGELRHFLREDDRYRRQAGARPVAVEHAFGRDGEEPVAVPVGAGRHVRFEGTVDRVDVTAGGGLAVLDYKTGLRRPLYADPLAGGTRLQLPLYGLAARQRFRPAGAVDVRYWYVSDRGAVRGHFPQEGFVLDAGGEARLAEVVRTMVAAIDAGQFPANPSGCAICPYTTVCPPEGERQREWERKRTDPWVADYLAMVGPA